MKTGVRFAASAAFPVLLFLACENPMLDEIRERIVTDAAERGPVPTVLKVEPADGAAGVLPTVQVAVTFDVEMDGKTLNAQTVKLLALPAEQQVSGSLSYDPASRRVSFFPSSPLALDKRYRLVVSPDLKSAIGTKSRAFSSEFVTRYFGADEIGLELSYSSADMVLDAARPIYIQLYGLPLPKPAGPGSMAILDDLPITASGKYRIPRSRIPGGASEALVFLFHDIDGDYVSGDDGAGAGDSERIVRKGVPGNSADSDVLDGLISDGGNGFWVVDESLRIKVGEGLPVVYSDGSPIEADGFESLDSSGSYRQLAQGIFETARNLHLPGDVDYLRLTPATTDHYVLEVGATSYQLRAGLYQSDSNALTRSSPLGDSAGTDERQIFAGRLTGGATYYVRIESPVGGLGPYELGYRFRPVPQEASESNDTPSEAEPLPFGRSNAVAAVLGAEDTDVYALTVEAGKRYALELAETANYYGADLAKRNLSFSVTMYTSWDGSNGAGIWQVDTEGFYQTANGRVMFDAPKVGVTEGSATRWLVVRNESAAQGGTGPRADGRYSLLYTWGPDSEDKEYVESLGGSRSDDPVTAALSQEMNVLYPSDAVVRRTIYGTANPATPGTDVDWFRIRARNNMTQYILQAESAAGTDGVVVEFDVYRAADSGGVLVPDLAGGVQASGQAWSGSQNEPVRGVAFIPYMLYGYQHITDYPTEAQGTFFVRVRRSTAPSANPATGAYTLRFYAGADDEDYQVPDSTVTVGGVPYGIDETPWMGQPNSTDFSDRNKLALADEWLGGSTPLRYNTIRKRDYDLSTGNPDGFSFSADHDFLWAELPGGMTSVYLITFASVHSYPGMPVKATVYRVPRSGSGAYATILSADGNSDKVVTEAELSSYLVGTYTSQAYFTTNGDHQIFESIGGLNSLGGDVLFVRVERNDAGAQAGDPVYTEYGLRLMQ